MAHDEERIIWEDDAAAVEGRRVSKWAFVFWIGGIGVTAVVATLLMSLLVQQRQASPGQGPQLPWAQPRGFGSPVVPVDLHAVGPAHDLMAFAVISETYLDTYYSEASETAGRSDLTTRLLPQQGHDIAVMLAPIQANAQGDSDPVRVYAFGWLNGKSPLAFIDRPPYFDPADPANKGFLPRTVNAISLETQPGPPRMGAQSAPDRSRQATKPFNLIMQPKLVLWQRGGQQLQVAVVVWDPDKRVLYSSREEARAMIHRAVRSRVTIEQAHHLLELISIFDTDADPAWHAWIERVARGEAEVFHVPVADLTVEKKNMIYRFEITPLISQTEEMNRLRLPAALTLYNISGGESIGPLVELARMPSMLHHHLEELPHSHRLPPEEWVRAYAKTIRQCFNHDSATLRQRVNAIDSRLEQLDHRLALAIARELDDLIVSKRLYGFGPALITKTDLIKLDRRLGNPNPFKAYNQLAEQDVAPGLRYAALRSLQPKHRNAHLQAMTRLLLQITNPTNHSELRQELIWLIDELIRQGETESLVMLMANWTDPATPAEPRVSAKLRQADRNAPAAAFRLENHADRAVYARHRFDPAVVKLVEQSWRRHAGFRQGESLFSHLLEAYLATPPHDAMGADPGVGHQILDHLPQGFSLRVHDYPADQPPGDSVEPRPSKAFNTVTRGWHLMRDPRLHRRLMGRFDWYPDQPDKRWTPPEAGFGMPPRESLSKPVQPLWDLAIRRRLADAFQHNMHEAAVAFTRLSPNGADFPVVLSNETFTTDDAEMMAIALDAMLLAEANRSRTLSATQRHLIASQYFSQVIKHNAVACLRAMVDRGFNLNAGPAATTRVQPNTDGPSKSIYIGSETALYHAICRGEAEIVEEMLRLGADHRHVLNMVPHALNYYITVKDHDSSLPAVRLMKALHDSGADLNQVMPSGRRLIHECFERTAEEQRFFEKHGGTDLRLLARQAKTISVFVNMIDQGLCSDFTLPSGELFVDYMLGYMSRDEKRQRVMREAIHELKTLLRDHPTTSTRR